MVTTPSNASDQAANPSRSLSQALQNIEFHVRDTKTQLAAVSAGLGAAIKALAAKDQVDETALAAAIVALLPEPGDVTVEKLTAALRALIVPAAG
jgi:hypothetical protein